MKKLQSYSISILIFTQILFVKCSHNNNETTENVYNNNGKLATIKIHHDITGNTTILKFYDNNILESIDYFSRDSFNEKYIDFYKNGNIRSIRQFVKGIYYGPTLLYYSNGYLRKYYNLDLFHCAFYVIEWDSCGQILKDNGNIFSRNCNTNIKDSVIKINSTFYFEVPVAIPPGYRINIELTKIINSKVIYKSKKNIIDNFTVHIDDTAKINGLYKYLLTAQLLNQMTGFADKKDTVSFDVYVQ